MIFGVQPGPKDELINFCCESDLLQDTMTTGFVTRCGAAPVNVDFVSFNPVAAVLCVLKRKGSRLRCEGVPSASHALAYMVG